MQFNLNWVDATIYVLLLLGLIWGLWQGIVRMLTAVLGFIAGALVTFAYGSTVLIFPSAPVWVNYILLFFIATFIVNLGGWILRKSLKQVTLGWIDNILGGIVGLLLGFMIMATVIYGLSRWKVTKRPIARSTVVRTLNRILPVGKVYQTEKQIFDYLYDKTLPEVNKITDINLPLPKQKITPPPVKQTIKKLRR